MFGALLYAATVTLFGADSLAQVVPADTVWVSVGSHSYHREPKAGLGIHNQHGRVDAKGDTVVFWVHRKDAEGQGMTPCRFCFPFRRPSKFTASPAAKAKAARDATTK
jgi:hypothetical protein